MFWANSVFPSVHRAPVQNHSNPYYLLPSLEQKKEEQTGKVREQMGACSDDKRRMSK